MEENEKEEKLDQGIIKLASDPNLLAAILDDENTTENVQNSEKFSDNTAENTLNMNQQNNDSVVMDDKGDVLGNGEGELLADSLELKDDEVNDGSQNTERSMNLQEDRSDVITENGSSVITESLTKSVDSSTLSSKDVKQKDSDNNSVSPQSKQKPKVNHYYIDKNKANFSRKPGKSSYAALYSQKLKLKQGNTNQNKGKTGISKEKENEESKREKMEQYDQFNDSSSSFSSKLSNTTTYANFDKSGYYNVLDYSMQSPFENTNQSIIPNYESYMNQPYHVPYRDFGLRYSNYGHQTYQTSSAMPHPQSNVMVPVAQIQGYASQSAPPGVVYQRRPLIDQVEFFPEHDFILSQSLTNSQFINPVQLYQRDSGLERKFVSEPQLSNTQLLSNEKDRASKLSDGTRSYSNPQKPVDYKPYTLKEYRQIKNEQPDMLGSLGPDTESDNYKEKVS